MSDEKYVVFKVQKFVHWLDDGGVMPEPLADAVVIRTKDPFAAPALYAYAHAIRHQAAMMRRLINGPRHMDKVVFEQIDNLDEIAEYFESAAQEAEEIFMAGDWKVPD